MLAEYLYADSMQVSISDSKTDLGIQSGRAYRNREIAREMPTAIQLSEPRTHSSSDYAVWEWVPAGKSFTLSAGKHRLIVHSKDDGVKLDCMVLYREGESR
jgi:hypothetical protein